MWVRQSTATTLVLGPFVDSTDGFTAETALTVTQSEVLLSKNAGAFAQKSETTSLTHMSNGHYSCLLNTTDTNTLGKLRIQVNETGALPVWMDVEVVPAMIYDSQILGTDRIDVNVTHALDVAWASGAIAAGVLASNSIVAATLASGTITSTKFATGAITASTFAGSAIDAAAMATDAIGANEMSAAAASKIGAAVWAEATRTLTSLGTGTGLTAIPWNSAWDAEVQSECQDAITASSLATATDLATVDTVVDSIKTVTDKLDTALELDGAVYRYTTNALEQAPTGGGAADGSGFTSIPWNSAWDAEVQSEVTDALNAYDPPTRAELTTDTNSVLTAVDAVPTNAELATALGTADDAVLAQIALVKTKTDSLTFTKTNELDVNLQSVNDVTVNGIGTAGSPWGP